MLDEFDPLDPRFRDARLATFRVADACGPEVIAHFKSIYDPALKRRKKARSKKAPAIASVIDGYPVRRVLKRSSVASCGFFSSPKNGRFHVPGQAPRAGRMAAMPYESGLEERALALAECDPCVQRYIGQPLELWWRDGMTICRAFPDFLIWHDLGPFIIEVKPLAKAQTDEFRAMAGLLRTFFARHGVRYRVWTEEMIDLQPRASNCQELLLYRSKGFTGAEMRIVLRCLERQEPQPICDLAQALLGSSPGPKAARNAVYSMILRGRLVIDHSVPLSDSSLVHPYRKPL